MEGKELSSIHAEKTGLSANEKESIFHVPAKYLEIGAQGGDYTLDEFRAGDLVEEGDYRIDRGDAMVMLRPVGDNNATVLELSSFDLHINERGGRNVFRALFRYGPRDMFSGIDAALKVTVNGDEIRARARPSVTKDGRVEEGAYDLLLGKKTEEGDRVRVSFTLQRYVELDLDSRLYEGRFRAGYAWPGLALARVPEETRFVAAIQLQEKAAGASSPDTSGLPLGVDHDAKQAYKNWKVQIRQENTGEYYLEGTAEKKYYPFLYLSSRTGSAGRKALPPAMMRITLDPSRVKIGNWQKLKILVGDLFSLSLSRWDRVSPLTCSGCWSRS